MIVEMTMNMRIRTSLVALISLAFRRALPAQLVQKKALNLEIAKQIAAAAEKEAAGAKLTMVIAILDEWRQPDLPGAHGRTQIGSIEVAQQKAHSAVAFKRPTKVFEDAVAGGRTAILSCRAPYPWRVACRLWRTGRSWGPSACSGGTSQQDGVVAKAGADALMKIVGH